MTEAGSLVVQVASRPMLVAARLRQMMEQRGFRTLKPGAPVPPLGCQVVLRPVGPLSVWVHPEHPEVLPDEVGRLLSQELRCRVISVATVADICAYEIADGGHLVEKLAARGCEVLEDLASPHAAAVAGGADLAGLLSAAGLDEVGRGFSEALAAKRVLRLGFAPPAGFAGAEVIEIDPTLSCPVCGSAMRGMTGKFGPFFGCVRFPTCRGRLTEKQATAQRAKG